MSKIDLKNVTLLSYNCVDPIQSVKALIYSSRHINFAEMILVSNTQIERLPSFIKFIYYDGKTHNDSSIFSHTVLADLFNTEFCLSIHDDGFVINPHLWDDEFLKYDYIGAPWFHTIQYYGPKYRIGNGGFSLRSKKLTNLCKKIPLIGNEDANIGIKYRDFLESQGCKFPPVELAMKFSLEEQIPECDFNLNNTFGFHGRGNPNMDPSRGHYQQFLDKIKLLDEITF